MQLDYLPPLLGLLAGVTVFAGTLPFPMIARRVGPRGVGSLQAVAGGVLAYLSLEIGAGVASYVEGLAAPETLGEFLEASIVTTLAMVGTWYALAVSERWEGFSRLVARAGVPDGGDLAPARVSLIVAVGLGIHNVGEGLAIAAALLAGAVARAMLFTIGFAIHNFTEGFAISGPITGSAAKHRPPYRFLAMTAAIAGLPTLLGASVYYVAVPSEMLVATMNTIAVASIIYAMLRINLSALAKLGGPSSPAFWLSIAAGVALTYTVESIILFTGAQA